MKQIIGYFRYGRGNQKANNTYAEKIVLARLRSLTQFFRHKIDNSFYRLSPLDSLTFTSLRFGRLAEVLRVKE